MIKRILNPKDFEQLADDIFNLFEFENDNQSHSYLKHNKEMIKNCYANKYLLAWDFFVWGHHNGKFYDALIIFSNEKSAKFGENLFSEFIWLSKNPKVGYKLFTEARKFAKEKGFKYILMNRVLGHPKSQSVADFYEKIGFVKDSETYIAKI